jgi:diguanylate cyclase (GGDEF)-like protein/hemerythrin-like metal-binding protein/PAS domain S-box-containing protein
MRAKPFQSHSLKTRVTLFTLGIFVFSVSVLAFYVSQMLRQDMQHLLEAQQLSSVTYMAEEVNHELQDRLETLEKMAARISPAMLDSSTALQTFLEDRISLLSLFNGGAFVTRVDGTAIADVPRSTGRIGINYIERDAMRAALKQGRPTIGRPIMGKMPASPVFAIAVPIRNQQGTVIGALAGINRLDKPNFLDTITRSGYGKSGENLLVAAQDRLIMTASKKERVMAKLAEPGVSSGIDRLAQGLEGSSIYVNPLGVEVLAASKRIAAVGWLMHTSVSTDEAFAPIRAMQRRMLLATLLLTLLAAALTWLMLSRQLSPMQVAVKALARQASTDQAPQPLPVTSQDEIGDLIGGFNHLLVTLRRQEQALRQSETKFRMLYDSSSDAVMLLDHSGFLDCNPAALALFGCATKDEFCRHTPADLSPPTQPDGTDSARLAAAHIERANQDGSCRFEWLHQRADNGQTFSAEVLLNALRLDGQTTLQASVRDISERKRTEDEVRRLAFHDPLTQLPNRRLLHDRLSQTLGRAKREQSRLALLFIDLDNFKPVNDEHGHEVGDWLLQAVAGRIASCLRASDTAARVGGDEFVVLLPDLPSSESALAVATKIRLELELPIVTPLGLKLNATASIGVAIYPEHGHTEQELLYLGDEAMYRAKQAGGNAVELCALVSEPLDVAGPFTNSESIVNLNWKASYACGQQTIDQEHRELFRLANMMLGHAGAGKHQPGQPNAVFLAAFDALLKHVVMHFAHEEEILLSRAYPQLAQHAQLHQALVEQAYKLRRQADEVGVTMGELVEFLVTEVVVKHMLGVDRKFYGLFAGGRGRERA